MAAESHLEPTRLKGRKVLITGGEVLKNELVTLASAEIFDPATETFAPTGPMGEGRIGHTTVRLKEGVINNGRDAAG